ncbi:MAG: c-type cytochrome [Pirellulaceae bacterium]|nr:c-type cytochrome [Pirellulaceae bacterium]
MKLRTMLPSLTLACLASLQLNLPVAMAADGPASVRIPGYERFHRPAGGDSAAAGLLLLGELNCLACHPASDAVRQQVHSKTAPRLSDAGQRLRPEYYQAMLSDPQQIKPGSTMPDLFGADAESLRKLEAVSHFLASQGKPAERAPLASQVARGRVHFRQLGCGACHDVPESDAAPLATSVPLGRLAAKYSIPSLAEFLSNPLQVRPAGRMPHMNLTAQEAAELAAWLLRDLQVPAGLTFREFHGSWNELPDFDQMEPRETGSAHAIDVAVASRTDAFGLSFQGRLRIEREGEYTFHLGSDDGSRLWIDGRQVVDCGGIHPYTVRSGKVRLESGELALRVDYFEQGGEERLTVELEGPGVSRRPVESLLVVPDEGRPRLQVDSNLVRAGRDVFQQVGCASCHELRENDQPLATERTARALAELNPTAGCLAEAPAAGLPRYALDATQRLALQAALGQLQTGLLEPADDATTIHQALTTLNCYACHERNGVGGAEAARNALFESNQPEMGDEGRLPPHLTGIGDKLRGDWLQHVLQQGTKERPYMFTRMPRFGEPNVEPLAAALVREDRTVQPEFNPDIAIRRLKVAGKNMVGAKGYSCIKCHTFAKYRSEGIQAMNLTTMTRRMNADWFRRYMLNPQAFRPGTRMPSAWPNGTVFLRELLDADAETQIHAVWTYLSDGDNAALPLGLQTSPLELVPIDHAILYRNFIEGAGTRAIGVGYPERVNLAYDANELRPALLWQGAFIDASRHWSGRGEGFQPPLGDNVLRLTAGTPLARLNDAEAAWPSEPARKQGYHFLGYETDSRGQPTFRYRLGEIQVSETFLPIVGDDLPALQRSLTLQSPQAVDNLWLRAAAAAAIQDEGQGGFVVQEDWRLRVQAPGSTPRLRTSGNARELLLPITLPAGRPVTVTLEYRW